MQSLKKTHAWAQMKVPLYMKLVINMYFMKYCLLCVASALCCSQFFFIKVKSIYILLICPCLLPEEYTAADS